MTVESNGSWGGISQYASIASIADCVPLRNGTRALARMGSRNLAGHDTAGCASCCASAAQTRRPPIPMTSASEWRLASMRPNDRRACSRIEKTVAEWQVASV